jgi:hypothetical protein
MPRSAALRRACSRRCSSIMIAARAGPHASTDGMRSRRSALFALVVRAHGVSETNDACAEVALPGAASGDGLRHFRHDSDLGMLLKELASNLAGLHVVLPMRRLPGSEQGTRGSPQRFSGRASGDYGVGLRGAPTITTSGHQRRFCAGPRRVRPRVHWPEGLRLAEGPAGARWHRLLVPTR